MHDKREFTRIRLPFPAVAEVGGQDFSLPEVEDLSASGFFLPCAVPAAAGTEVHLSIDLSEVGDGPFIEMRGEVVRATDDGMGVRFVAIDATSFEHLRNVLRFNAEDPDKVEAEFAAHLGLKRGD